MGNMAIPPGCHSSIEKCVDALCAEQSKGSSVIKWLSRFGESMALGQIDENLGGGYVSDKRIETPTRIIGSSQYGNKSWASDKRFAEAWNHQYSTPDQKATLRQQIAQDYLKDHPDDCQPPAPAVRRKPIQLSLFESPATASARAILPESDHTSAWWTSPGWIAVGASVALGKKVATAATAVRGAITGGLAIAGGFMMMFCIRCDALMDNRRDNTIL